MSADTQWMPLYIGDYHRDTGHLTVLEHGAYLLLLMQAWTRGGLLPADEKRLAALARCTPRQWAECRDAVLAFFTLDGGGYRNKRLDRELARASAISAERRRAGASGAAKRWGRHGSVEANGMANAIAEPSQPASQSDAHLHLQLQEQPPSPPSEVRPPRGCRLPDDWQPDADDAHFAIGLGLDCDGVAANFRDYWHAKAGKDATKLDWSATWRGWCRREADRGKRSAPASQQSKLGWMLQ